jgi:hypothetical protein
VIKVADIVREIIFSSETELTAISRRLLNLSAYAKRIHPLVEKRARKPVQIGTIVVALSRISTEVSQEDPLLPKIELHGIAVKSNLAEITFNKTSANKLRMQKLYATNEIAQSEFLNITYGASEITIFAPMSVAQSVLETFKPDKPKLFLDHLAALTIQFSEQYIETPNLYFALLRTMAVRKLNIIDLISTFTELTFLVRQEDLNELFLLMNALTR